MASGEKGYMSYSGPETRGNEMVMNKKITQIISVVGPENIKAHLWTCQQGQKQGFHQRGCSGLQSGVGQQMFMTVTCRISSSNNLTTESALTKVKTHLLAYLRKDCVFLLIV